MSRALAGVVAVGVGLFGACGVGGSEAAGSPEAFRDEAGPGEDAAAPMARDDAPGEEGLDREAVLGPFLSSHWQLPASAQGPVDRLSARPVSEAAAASDAAVIAERGLAST